MEGHQLIAAMRDSHLAEDPTSISESGRPRSRQNLEQLGPSRGGRPTGKYGDSSGNKSQHRGNYFRRGRGGTAMPYREPPGPPPAEWVAATSSAEYFPSDQSGGQHHYENEEYPTDVEPNHHVNGHGNYQQRPRGRGRGSRAPRGGNHYGPPDPHFNSYGGPSFHHRGPPGPPSGRSLGRPFHHGGPPGHPPFHSGPLQPPYPYYGPPQPTYNYYGPPRPPHHHHGPPHHPHGPLHHLQGPPEPPRHGAPELSNHHHRPFPDHDPQAPPPSYETAMMQTPDSSGDQSPHVDTNEPQRPMYDRGSRSANSQPQQWAYNQKRWTGNSRREDDRSGGRQPEESDLDDRGKRNSARRGADDYYRKAGPERDNPTRSWRDQTAPSVSSMTKSDQVPFPAKKGPVAEDDRTQRERLTDELNRGKCECMVCCDSIWQSHEVWSCQNCYNVFHLKCIKKWAHSPTESVNETGWRCPGCQNVTVKVPQRYLCFCGKRTNPTFNHYDTAHSCGEQCGRRRQQLNCVHPCNLLCHPGPCPPCGVYVTRECACGRLSEKVRCGQIKTLTCGQTCEKKLNCGVHTCPSDCHESDCDPCEEVVSRSCHCKKLVEEVPCTAEALANLVFSCEAPCGRPLECGNHFCQRTCHPGECDACTLAPELVTRCPCSKTPLEELIGGEDGSSPRLTCADPVPVCGQPCDRALACGTEGELRHQCQASCHEGPCPPCPQSSQLRCQCGSAMVEVACSTVGEGSDEAATAASSAMPVVKCTKRCNKKKSCGRHKCGERCCIDTSHQCVQTCGRKLTCGLHTCDDRCHLGNCHSCWNTSFDELSCHCGATVTFPPIPCGTRPPECPKICSRSHSCDHPVQHKCHSDPLCPPCTFLTSKYCYGNHELRSCIPCFRTDVSCGLPCNRPLPCGRHACILTCHSGPCVASEDAVCTQPCIRPRPKCDHPCNAPCHDGDCPTSHCRAMVSVTCKCGHRSGTKSCVENQQIYQRMVSAAMAVKQHNTEGGQSVDISDAIKDLGLKKNCTLECNSECALIDRNRRLALALQIRNPDLTNKLKPPAYSEFLKDQVRQVPAFVTGIHDRLTELVQSAKQSKQKCRSHAFPPMKSVNRRVIHELAEFFGCDTHAYDDEPKKNVVATAYRDKSFLPSTSVISVVQKEMGILRAAGKAPPPLSTSTRRLGNLTPLTGSSGTSSSSSPATSISGTTAPINPWRTVTSAAASSSTSTPSSVAKSAPPIDYFDYKE